MIDQASLDNLERITDSGRAENLWSRVLNAFEKGAQMTADEMAALLNEPGVAIKPRVTELRKAGFIEPTGERRKGVGGGTANVWRYVEARSA